MWSGAGWASSEGADVLRESTYLLCIVRNPLESPEKGEVARSTLGSTLK